MIKNIIFDWGGVLSDNLLAAYHAAMVVFRNFRIKEISFDEFKKEWEQPYMFFYNKYLPRLTIKEEKPIFKSAYKLTAKKYPPKLYPHVKDALQKFRVAGINMIIISSEPYKSFLPAVKSSGLKEFFKETNYDIHNKAEVVEKIIKKNKFDPKETIFIGDTTHEVDAGKSVGMMTGAVTWGYQDEDKLKSSHPDFIIHNLKELESIILE